MADGKKVPISRPNRTQAKRPMRIFICPDKGKSMMETIVSHYAALCREEEEI